MALKTAAETVGHPVSAAGVWIGEELTSGRKIPAFGMVLLTGGIVP
jgi:hypothetical protein